MTDTTGTAPASRAPAMTKAAVLGVGSSLPGRLVTNHELAARLDTSDEWIRTRTGIRTRRWAGPGISTSHLAVDAGSRALRSAGRTAVDALIVATTTPDRLCPATAPEVATRLGLTGIAAFDIAAVCSGFLYALANAAGLISCGAARTVLVIGAETYSTILNRDDRTTAVIFGDGAGAVVLGAATPGTAGEVGPCVLGSDGTLSDLIQIPAGGSRQRSSGRPAAETDACFQMRGREVFRHAVTRMCEAAEATMGRAGLSGQDIDAVVPHQANLRICEAIGKRLGLDSGRMLSNVDSVGNTSAASIPILLAEASADGRIKAGYRLLLMAFGGGLTWGATTLTWPDITPEPGFLETGR